MSKFKVGDRVLVVYTEDCDKEYTVGEELCVKEVDGELCFFDRVLGLRHDQLELATNTETAPAPPHYLEGRPPQYEPRFVIAAWGLTYQVGSAVKYIARLGRKGDPVADQIHDLKKARNFLQFEIERLQGAGYYGDNGKAE